MFIAALLIIVKSLKLKYPLIGGKIKCYICVIEQYLEIKRNELIYIVTWMDKSENSYSQGKKIDIK